MNPIILYDEQPERGERLAAILRDAGYEVMVVTTKKEFPEAPGGRRSPLRVLSLNDAERLHIAAVLEHTGGNRREAAHLLGIARSTLLSKIRRFGLE